MEGSSNSDAICDKGELVNSDSFVASLKNSPRSPSSSPWGSDSEYVITSDNEGPFECIELKQELLHMERKIDNNMVWEEANKSYDELLKKFIENEEELRFCKSKLQLSDEEIVMLKIQIEESKDRLDYMSEELKLKEEDLEHEKEQVMELQKQTVELETHVPDCCYKIAKLVEQLDVANENLKISNDENVRLRKELGKRSFETLELQGQLDIGRKQIQELENKIRGYEANEANLHHEVQNLKGIILHGMEQFSLEKDKLHLDIASLSEIKIQLTSSLEEWESRSNALENIIRQLETESLKQEELHASQQMALQGEITSLREELGGKKHVVEAMNKKLELHVAQQGVLQGEITYLKEELDKERYVVEVLNKMQLDQQLALQCQITSLKEEVDQKRQDVEDVNKEFDMLVIEKDEANAMIDKLKVEISSRDDQIEDRERMFFRQYTRRINNLTMKVEQLQKEVIRKNDVISHLAEEKREAIRQLCFSLEHYRIGYQELLQAFIGHRHHAVIAS